MTPVLASAIAWIVPGLLLLCLGGQVLHGYLRIMHSNPRSRRSVALYEGAVFCHVALMAAVSTASVRTEPELGIAAPFDTLPLCATLWANVAIALVVGYAILADIDDTGESDDISWMLPLEVALACVCTPPILLLLGEFHTVALVADAAYATFRTAFLLVRDNKNTREIVSPLALGEALKHMPEGILYADESGRIILANNVMRQTLSALGIAINVVRIEELWRLLNEKSADTATAISTSEPLREPGSWIALRINEHECRLFSYESADDDPEEIRFGTHRLHEPPLQEEVARSVLGKAPHFRIIAYDVTEDIKIIEEIELTNDELSSSQQELVASVEAAREAAENEAMLKMRGRVHDVIGQRLSLLHRALEDNAISDEELAHLKPLITGIMDDLMAGTRTEPSDELAATVEAFALSGIEVRVEGSLPGDEKRAKLFADCIREATTNAVKHARARVINVRMHDLGLEVENDGMLPTWPIKEGTGLANMRRAVEAAGGSLEITPNPFTLRVKL